MLGLYRVLEKLTETFPGILFESCGGGGGRFDASKISCPLLRHGFLPGIPTAQSGWHLYKSLSSEIPSGGKVSRNLHKAIREHICRGEWKDRQRPVLINNWEATYFTFTGEKLIAIAKEAKNFIRTLFTQNDERVILVTA